MERLRRAIDAGPSVLCHVEGSQSKRIRNAQNIALRSTARGGIYRRGAARGSQTAQAQETAHAGECGQCIAKSGAVRRSASEWPRHFQDRPVRSRRAHVPAPRQDALTGDLARPDDSSGPHRLYRPGAANRSNGTAEERRRALPRYRRARGRRSFAGRPHPLPGLQSTGVELRGRSAPDDALPSRRRVHRRPIGGHRLHHEQIAAENTMVVVSANYRLAPEWPFPACLDDCLAVLQWMRKNGATLGGDGTRIAVGGDSAGGNLAAALVIKARDEGVSPPQAAVLLAPITDFFFEQHESFERLAPLGIVYDTAFIGFIRGAYLVHGENWAHPHASPARADLRNYPPTFIATGTADPLVDDNRAFAQKLRAAGGEKVEHFVREGMPHGFYFFPGMFKQGDEAFAAIATFLKQAGTA